MKFKKRRYLWIGLFAALLTFTGLWKFYQVYAAAGDYNFFYEGEMPAAGEIELKTNTGSLIVQGKAGLDPKSISWKTSDDKVVDIEVDPIDKMFVKLNRVGPGYSKITAIIKESETAVYTLTCMVKVDFKVDKKDLPFKPLFTTDSTNSDENNVMVLGLENGVSLSKAVKLKYADEKSVESTMVWESKDSSIVSVNADTGIIKVEGAGETEIEVRTNTTLEEKPIAHTFKVIVEPKAQNPKDVEDPRPFRDKFKIEEQTFQGALVFKTNAASAAKLNWVVYDEDYKIAPEGRVSYSTDGSSLIVSGAKYGKYYIRGYIKNDYKPNPITATSTVGFIEIELNVLLYIKNTEPGDEVVMNVGDTYSVPDNSNVPSAGILGYKSSDSNIADVENNNGVIEAKSVGEVTITLSVIGTDIERTIKVKVIDGIALNYSSVKIYTAGTVKLKEFVTNTSVPVVWSSDKPNVATVENGLVTGISQGTAKITVSQTINGVVKSATCIVQVEPSVTKITLDPAEVSLNKQEKATVTATIEPNTLNNVSLKWMSSNENVVKIEKAYDLSATIQGLAAGTAVITAVNQENVVVGYCQVTVKERVTKVTLSDSAVTLSLAKKTYQLSAYVSPDTATNKKINWTSTNTKVATVDSNGLVTLVSGGTASIIAASDDNPAATAMCTITVETPASSLVLDEKTKEMNVGETYRLGYVITPTNAANKEVSWSSSNTAVATVDATGLIKAVAAGQAIITVKTADGTLTASCTITVKQKATGISLDATDLELYVNQSYELKATVTPASSTDYKLTWESSNSTVATVDDKGKVTAIAAGRTTITVKTSTGQVAYCSVTVKQQATGLQLNYKEKTVVIGEAFTIKATIVPSSAADEVSVNWSSSKTSVATVSATGEVKGIKGGTAVITCKTDDGKFTEFCVVTVVERVTSVTLNKSNIPVGLKKTYALKATVKTNAATDPSIRWTSSNTKIASVDASGKVTGKAIGTVTITATAQDGSGEKDTCTVRVVRQATSLTLNKTSVTTVEGRTFKLTANIRPSNATYKTVDWTSSDEKIAIVDSNGQVTALTEGNVTIKAAAKDNSGKAATCFVIVQPRTPANSVTIINQNLTMVVGETATIQKAINPSASTDRVTWQSDNKTVASVDASTGKVTARTPGIASVTVMTESGKTATTKITVVGLNTTNLVLEQYSTYRLSVIGMTSGVTWDVDDNDIAVVTNGLVSSRRLGTTTITATVNGRRLTCRLQVVKIK